MGWVTTTRGISAKPFAFAVVFRSAEKLVVQIVVVGSPLFSNSKALWIHQSEQPPQSPVPMTTASQVATKSVHYNLFYYFVGVSPVIYPLDDCLRRNLP